MGTPVATAKEYYENFGRTNYVDLASVLELYDLLNSSACPYIPVGSHNGYMYRLDPRLGILEANIDSPYVDLAANPIVAINLVGQRIHFADAQKERIAKRGTDRSDES